MSRVIRRQRHGRPHPGQGGFTLMEVLVALTITGMALGGIFSVIAGNKQLAWRSEEALVEALQARNLINYAQLHDGLGTVDLRFGHDRLLLATEGEYEVPERKTAAANVTLRHYELLDENGEPVAEGSYWVELELPE